MIDTLSCLFPHILCDRTITGTASPGACLYLYINRCPAPCIGLISSEAVIAEIVDDMVRFLEGKNRAVMDDLCRQMEAAAENLEFERAADLRNRLRAAERVIEQERHGYTTLTDQDILGLARDDSHACLQVFYIRGGQLARRAPYFMINTEGETDQEILSAFVKQFYSQASEIPEELVLPQEPGDLDAIHSWLKELGGRSVRLSAPQRGEKRRMVDLASKTRRGARADESGVVSRSGENQRGALGAAGVSSIAQHSSPHRVLRHLQYPGHQLGGKYGRIRGRPPEALRLSPLPDQVGHRRHDFASHQEVLRRRFKRALDVDGEAGASWGQIPDLVIIDGGKGQLSAALEVMEELELTEFPVVGLAKENEEIFVKGRSAPILLPRVSQSLYLVQRIRDEAHRFAITYHRSMRGKKSIKSALDDVQGIGPARNVPCCATLAQSRVSARPG